MIDRPDNFEIDYSHPLADRLVFCALGSQPGAVDCRDSSQSHNHGTLCEYATPSDGWQFAATLGRFANVGFSANKRGIRIDTQSRMYVGDPVGAVSFWLRHTKTSGLNTHAYIIMHRGVGDTRQWYLSIDFSDRLAVKVYPLGTAASLENLTLNPYAASTTWRHFSLNIRAAQHWDLSVNGSFVHTFSSTAPYANRASWLEIGGAHNLDSLFSDAEIADVMYHQRGLTTDEMLLLADPSNTMLSGLLYSPVRRDWVFFSSELAGLAWKPWQQPQPAIIGGGLI